MLIAHGDTPLHDDPAFLYWIGGLGGTGLLSFLWYWITH